MPWGLAVHGALGEAGPVKPGATEKVSGVLGTAVLVGEAGPKMQVGIEVGDATQPCSVQTDKYTHSGMAVGLGRVEAFPGEAGRLSKRGCKSYPSELSVPLHVPAPVPMPVPVLCLCAVEFGNMRGCTLSRIGG